MAAEICSEYHNLIIDGVIQPDGGQRRRLLIAVVYLGISVIFLPICFFDLTVFCSRSCIKQSCYKLLIITTALDILNLVNSALVPGILSLLNVTPCNGGGWSLYFGFYHIVIWTAYCSASEILAINRVMIFAKPDWAAYLYDGKRCWLWTIVIVAYVLGCFLWMPYARYVYDTSAGIIYDWKFNPMHVFNNFFKMGFLTSAYSIMLLLILKRFRHRNIHLSEMTQIKISLLTLATAVLADIGAVGYIVAMYLPKNSALQPFTGVIAQLCWISLHAGTGLIYLLFNQTVYDHFRRALRRKHKTIFVAIVFPNHRTQSTPH